MWRTWWRTDAYISNLADVSAITEDEALIDQCTHFLNSLDTLLSRVQNLYGPCPIYLLGSFCGARIDDIRRDIDIVFDTALSFDDAITRRLHRVAVEAKLVHRSDAQPSTPVVKRENIPLASSSSIQPLERAALISTTCIKEQVIDRPDAQDSTSIVKRENASFAPSSSAPSSSVQQYYSRPLPNAVEEDKNTSYPTSGIHERAAMHSAAGRLVHCSERAVPARIVECKGEDISAVREDAIPVVAVEKSIEPSSRSIKQEINSLLPSGSIVEARNHPLAPSATPVEQEEDTVPAVEKEASVKLAIDPSLTSSVEKGEDMSSKPSSIEHKEGEETTYSPSSNSSQRQRSRRRRRRPHRTRRRNTCSSIELASTTCNVGVQDIATYDRLSPDDDDPSTRVATLESLPPYATKSDDQDHSFTQPASTTEQEEDIIAIVEEEKSVEPRIATTLLTSVEEGEDTIAIVEEEGSIKSSIDTTPLTSVEEGEDIIAILEEKETVESRIETTLLTSVEEGEDIIHAAPPNDSSSDLWEHATDSEDDHVMDLVDQFEDTKALARSYRRFRDRGRARRRLGARAAANSTAAPPIVQDALDDHSEDKDSIAMHAAHDAIADQTILPRAIVAPNDSTFDSAKHAATCSIALSDDPPTDAKSRPSNSELAEVMALDSDAPDPILSGLSNLCTDIRADISSLDNLQSEMTSTIREGLDFLQCYDADESSTNQMPTSNLDLPDTDNPLLPSQPTDNRQITPEATFSSLDGTQDMSTFSTRDVSIILPAPDRQRLSQDQDPSHATSIVAPTVAATLDSSCSSKLQQQDETDKLCGDKCTSTSIVDARLSTDSLKLAVTIFDDDDSFPDSIQHAAVSPTIIYSSDDDEPTTEDAMPPEELHVEDYSLSTPTKLSDEVLSTDLAPDPSYTHSKIPNVSSPRRFQPQTLAPDTVDDPDSTAIVSDDNSSDLTMIETPSTTTSLDEGPDIHTSFDDTLPSDEVDDSSTSAPIKNADDVLSTDLAPDPTYFTSNSNASDPHNFTERAPDPRATSVIVAANATY